jgi:nuclear transport factor 2 (NTF2) superfamily protein
MPRPPLPPFTLETATREARLAEDAWNGRDRARVSLACSPDSRRRRRSTFLQARAEIERHHHWTPGRHPDERADLTPLGL